MTRQIYFNVAGLNLRINLVTRAHEGPIKMSVKKRFEKDLLAYLGDFMTKRKSLKPDFTIDVDSDFNPLTSFWPYKDKGFMMIFKTISKRKIITYYQTSIYQFRFVFHYALSILLGMNKGFSLHCSSILNNSRVDLFLGKSGAGKTTISEFLEGYYLKLSDDITFIRKDGKEFFFYEGPEIDKNWEDKAPGKYKLGNIFFLKKSNLFKIEHLNRNRAIKLIMEDIVNSFNKKSVENLIKFVNEFNNFYVLYFAKDRQKMVKLYESISVNQ